MKARNHTALRRLWLLPLLLLIAGVGLNSCYQDYGLSTQDFDTYLTHYAPGTNFQAFKYYIFADSTTIRHIYDTTKTDPLAGAHKYDKQILSLIRGNLEARGYQGITDTTGKSAATFVVLVAQMSFTYTGYYYDYWGSYWGYYWPGSYYPPYYPPAYGGTYQYSTGTNITELVDLGQSVAAKRPTPVWSSVISGLTGSPSTAPTRITMAINRTFEQSPYLYSGQ